MTGSTIGHYRIADKLGAGGMGEVWRARDTRLNRDVAIKVLPPGLAADPERMARFEREAQVLASLNHTNIAVLHGLEIAGDSRALVMELVEGETLAERIARGSIPLDEAMPIAKQIAEALEAAHEHGIIHRDLKPANVKITPQGVVKLLDFGLAKAFDDAPGESKSQANSPTLSVAATRAGVLLGTAGYMSPEQVKGKSADKRADIWAFGVVLYEMLTGRQLYRGETLADSLAAVITSTPDTSVLPPGVRRLVERCLEKDARFRLRDIGEARIALERPESGAAVHRGPRLTGRAPLALIPTLAFAALAFVHFRETPPEPPRVALAIPTPSSTPARNFAISPDGRYVVIATAGMKSPMLLRPIDSQEVAPLGSTEEAQYPFWSPDSRFIAFFSQGKLRKVAVSGGPPVALCDAANGRGGGWGPDGTIVFAPDTSSGIFKVSADGGTPVRIVAPAGGTQRFPILLPDGKRLLYVLSAATGNVNGVYAADVDGKSAPRRILSDVSSVAWIPPRGGPSGHLLFIRDSTLMVQPTNPRSLDRAGDVFPVAERVDFSAVLNYAPIAASPAGHIAFLRGAVVGGRNVAWMDRQGRILKSFEAPGTVLTILLSPDGRKIGASVVAGRAENADIWVLDSERGAHSQITFRRGRSSWPVWSPDGKQIAFAAPEGDSSNSLSALFVKDASGAGQERKLAPSTQFRYPTHWSSTGFLAFSELGSGAVDVMNLRMDGSSKPVTFFESKFNETWARFSPDGRWISYDSDETGSYEVYVRPVRPDGAAGEGKWKVSIGGGTQSAWTKGGREIVYLSPDSRLMAADVRVAGEAIEISAPRELFRLRNTPPNPGQRRFDVSLDGERIVALVEKEELSTDPISVILNWRPPAGRN
jgi:serine/threonine protein kinase/Tol biopolymer transport system component